MLMSITRTVAPGTPCSYPPGTVEVYHLAPYRPCLHSHLTAHDVRLSMRGRDEEHTRREARELAATFQRCCYVDGITYAAVELAEDDDPARAPLA